MIKGGLKGLIIGLSFLPFLSYGCAGINQAKNVRPRENITRVHRDVISLPVPERKISITVYKSRDMTGQYKSHPNVASFSNAVTQGSTAMLIKALLDSGWFLVVEREGLKNLLTEQKMLKSKLTFMGKNPDMIRTMVLPEFIIEGGITEFSENIVTGGFGIKYFGAGPYSQWRIASVVVDLRLVRVSSGLIEETASVAKRIMSKELDFGLYRFVRENRLLELEVGITSNEPVQMAVRETIEMAVMRLIAKGVVKNQWKPRDKEADFFATCLAEQGVRVWRQCIQQLHP